MLLLAIITLGVYKYIGWRRGKKLDKAVEKHAREVEQRRKLAKIRYAYGIPGMYGNAPSYRVLPSHTDEIPLSPDQYGYTTPNSPFQPFSSPPLKQSPIDLPRPQNSAATTDVTISFSSPPSLPLPTFAIGDDPWIGIEETMPSGIFPLKSTASIRRFEKRTSPLKRQFEMGSVEDDHGKAGFMRGKLFEKGSSLELGRVEKQTSTSTFDTGKTPIEDVFHTSLIHGPGVSDQSDHLEFTDAESSVTTR
ncbi:hypothetical protein I315_00624 [Cryptococcus gattii Ru294]|uniref:Uncharacterized protein n=2 Tax=Cryptococcus gattii TaxID=37769 RepID=E6R6F0_CRYGW|nr:Hypothetical protein CGB_E0480W [Cryptococcus gattii WM276]ADV22280.1 Hypothetical protein CGB_E0480W [Cryptococcus gattii WM276]KIR56450.1 hypothetical protein I315_00624 [Cryptococcus gattii Ru294]KIR78720.1 hypothetical protein I306_04289 [Cryptococcus gattii EJB2]KJE04824.1 hypothetical protein I311_01271 [Cryptococcus gattii NT-10]